MSNISREFKHFAFMNYLISEYWLFAIGYLLLDYG